MGLTAIGIEAADRDDELSSESDEDGEEGSGDTIAQESDRIWPNVALANARSSTEVVIGLSVGGSLVLSRTGPLNEGMEDSFAAGKTLSSTERESSDIGSVESDATDSLGLLGFTAFGWAGDELKVSWAASPPRGRR